jgi:hypothetical protein
MNKEKLNKYMWIILILCLFNCKTFNQYEYLKNDFKELEKESFIVEFDKSSLDRGGIDILYYTSDLDKDGYSSNGKLNNLENYMKLKNSKIEKPKKLVIIAKEYNHFWNDTWWLLSGILIPFVNPLFYMGCPLGSSTDKIILEGYIIDNQNKILKKYKSFGENTEYNALYHGYGKDDIHQPTEYGAMINALKNLRRQIENDYK